ncbi:F-box protein at3g58530-like protein [Trifolium pratense]|uniref:F-box protein at3g58530-like protein n=1 Tax=Trifolium pratense TaxID=57577 RepID=A0A2K3N1M3_TRIPR|nr:F-box protein at3g58530-like protein [Trifolium pratense]
MEEKTSTSPAPAMDEDDVWCKETVPKVLKLVCCSPSLNQKDLISLLFVSPFLYRTLLSSQPLWQLLNFREFNNAGNRLIAALSLPRYQHVKEINLEFASDIEDTHLILIKQKCFDSLQSLESLNLNGCQKISDTGIQAITSCCPRLKTFSVYWNVRVTDTGLLHTVTNCKHIVDLNISGCKNISDRGAQLVAENYPKLESLNLTRCVKLTDVGLKQLLQKCLSLQSLNLYAVSSFTDEAYKKICLLTRLTFLDLCGAQNLSDQGLKCISKCKNLVSLNLTWCVRVTDEGVIAAAQSCTSLEFLSSAMQIYSFMLCLVVCWAAAGEVSPEGAQTWLQGVDKIFRAMVCCDAQKVLFGTYMFADEAEYWGENARQRMDAVGTVITWECFKGEFLEKYFPADVRSKEIEFLWLKQGSMIVADYAAKFEELSRSVLTTIQGEPKVLSV